jgi:hypothetical protein
VRKKELERLNDLYRRERNEMAGELSGAHTALMMMRSQMQIVAGELERLHHIMQTYDKAQQRNRERTRE